MTVTRDSWDILRRLTHARVALGRAGGSRTTAEVLGFRLDHARAVDAVYAPFSTAAFEKTAEALDLHCVIASTQVDSREVYLRRPDLGRRLSVSSRESFMAEICSGVDIVCTIADGLSAAAVDKNAPLFLHALKPLLQEAGLSWRSLVITPFARVALQDEIGALLQAKVVLTLIGERPGLGTAESMGVYLVFNPKVGNTDAQRNCISNVHARGMSPALAARKTANLCLESLRLGLSGVGLKDDDAPLIQNTRRD